MIEPDGGQEAIFVELSPAVGVVIEPQEGLDTILLDRIFTDKASGKDVRRSALGELCAFVRHGDAVVVHSMDRLARNLDDLRRIVQGLTRSSSCATMRLGCRCVLRPCPKARSHGDMLSSHN